jgi:hypothetical protein
MRRQTTNETRERLRRIQDALGVESDGLLGSVTLTALEKRLGISVKESAASLQCSRKSLDLIVAFEVGSPRMYEQRFRRPVWPGGESGVTIGIGYDLGYTPKAEIEADWSPHLEQRDRAALLAAQGLKGESARLLAQNLQQIVIPFAAAEQVFCVNTLPRYARLTRATFPGIEKLPADAQGAILSLVYNRGASLAGARRAEMAEIRRIVAAGRSRLEPIAAQFESMTRLWPEVKGLRDRRVTEANLVRGARRKYRRDELIRV